VSTPAAAWQPYQGASYLAQSGQAKHLFVVLSDPIIVPHRGQRPCVIVVNFSSVKNNGFDDLTCVFHKNSHPFIHRDSFAFYRMAQAQFVDALVQNITSLVWAPHHDFSSADVKRLKTGFYASSNTPIDLQSLAI
jgi:hypothetical protein